MNKIGIQSGVLYDDSNFEWGLKTVKDAGFDCIDFDIDTKISFREVCEGKINQFFRQSDEELKEYYRPQKDEMEKTGITMSQMHGPFPILAKDNEQATEQLINATKKCIMLCDYFSCPYLIVHPIVMENKDEEREANLYIYKSLIEEAKKYKVGICLENMFKSISCQITEASCSDIREAVDYIDLLNGFAGEKIFSFCYDLGHATLLSKNIRRSLNLLGDRLTTLHIHDNNGVHDTHQQPYSNLRNGDYVTDWEGFLAGLRDIDFKGVLSFETFNSLRHLPKELYPAMVNYIGEVGKYFRDRLIK